MDDCLYNDSDHWVGGFYELSIEYHPSDHDKRINEALASLADGSCIKGISLPIQMEEDGVHSFYGSLSLSHSDYLPIMITVTRVVGESDWMDIAIPQTAFEMKFSYKYPLITELNPWLVRVNEVFVQLAETIYQNAPFDLALIGEEVSGCTNQGDITYEVMQTLICILPSQLSERLGLGDKGKELSNQLRVFGTDLKNKSNKNTFR